MTEKSALERDLHQLATTIGLLNLQWFLVTQELSPEQKRHENVEKFAQLLAEIRNHLQTIISNHVVL